MSKDKATDELIERIKTVLRSHGTADLYPEDEFDCCAGAVAELFEPYTQRAFPAERFYRLRR